MQAVKHAEKSSSALSRVAVRKGGGDRVTPLRTRLWSYRWTYLMILPGLLYLLIFHYIPLWGNIIAFQDFSIYRGFFGSTWVGLQNFVDIFSNPDIGYVVWNTVLLSVHQIIFAFPAA